MHGKRRLRWLGCLSCGPELWTVTRLSSTARCSGGQGRRDRTIHVPISKFNEGTLQSDFHFLEVRVRVQGSSE